MKYTLQLDLEGADGVQNTLNGLLAALGKIKGGGAKTSFANASKEITKSFEEIPKKFKQKLSEMREAWAAEMKKMKPVITITNAGKSSYRVANPFNTGDLTNTGAGLATRIPRALLEGTKKEEDRTAMLRRDARERMIEASRRSDKMDRAKMIKDLTFGIQPLLNPGSPWGILFALRQTFSAGLTRTGQQALGKIGLGGVGGAAIGAGALVAGLTAVGLSLAALKAVMSRLVDAIRSSVAQGFNIYSQAGQQGLSAKFYEQRTALASIFGISGNPNQVFMFGKAVTDMSKRISESTSILAKNSPALAQIHMNFDVLKLDFVAVASTLALEAAPAINFFLATLDIFVKKMLKVGVVLGTVAGMWALTPQGMGAMRSLINSVSAGNTLQEFLKPAAMLNPLMKQLPASQWEHMGLLIGGGSSNPMLHQLKLHTTYLKKIAGAVSGGGGLPRAQQFGLNPMTNLP